MKAAVTPGKIPLSRHMLRRMASGWALGTAICLAGCASSAPFNFYTLSNPDASTAVTAPVAGARPLQIEVMPTNVPAQVQRPQLLLTTDDGQVAIVEQQRWSQPLADEISQGLSQDLTRRLPAIDVYRSPHAADQPLYRIAVNVQRFESAPGRHTVLEAVWSVTAEPRGLALTCHTLQTEPVAASGTGIDYPALIDAHRRALQYLSGRIAKAIDALSQVPTGHAGESVPLPDCPAGP